MLGPGDREGMRKVSDQSSDLGRRWQPVHSGPQRGSSGGSREGQKGEWIPHSPFPPVSCWGLPVGQNHPAAEGRGPCIISP